jgi:hypothetical protein
MIVVRNIFRIKFGQAKPAIAAFKQVCEVNKKLGISAETHLLADLVGTSYTLVYEFQFESLAMFEQAGKKISGSEEWRAQYEKFIPFAESGSREIFTIVG